MRRPKPVVGWREWLELPDLGVAAVKAKVDTGARSSSLHAYGIERFRQDGRTMVRFAIHPLQRHSRPELVAVAEVIDERMVRNPGGRSELRPVILTHVGLAGITWPVEINLTTRDEMGFRMLLGRQAVRGRFVVDPGRSYIAGRTTPPSH
jgi:hypothetical protein